MSDAPTIGDETVAFSCSSINLENDGPFTFSIPKGKKFAKGDTVFVTALVDNYIVLKGKVLSYWDEFITIERDSTSVPNGVYSEWIIKIPVLQ